MTTEYAELHCHSSFSFLDGASNPEELVFRAKQIGLRALALTDHDDLGGIVRFAHTATEVEIPAIVGAELTMADETHLTVLAEDLTGYKNLCHLLTWARSVGNRGSPRVSYQKLFERAQGLVVLSGCPHGRLAVAAARGDIDLARQHITELQDVFSDRFYIEVWHHQINQEAIIAKKLIELANAAAIPWVVTNNVHYARPEKRIIHDVLTCVRHEVTLNNAGRRLRPNASYYLRSAEEMGYIWRQDLTGVKNSLVVADRCSFRHGLLKAPLPVFEVPPGLSHNGMLEKLVWEGAKARYGDLSEQHVKQLNHELSMITRLELGPYFLIVWDIVQFARSQGIAVQGRGSAANSAVCYCLFITAVDPIGMDLLFERFLSEGRNEPPDIDLDIAHQEREKVLQYVYEKYGREHAAMVCEIITYRGRSAVRDAARVLGFSQDQADRLSAQANYGEAKIAAFHLANGGIEAAGLDSKDFKVQQLIRVVAGLHQLPRHRSIHVGGFVLSGELLGDIVPVEPASMHGRTVIQWDKDDLDLAGLIKIDLLGLGMLTMIQEGLKLVKKHRQQEIELGRLDMKDPAIYEMLRQADTIGLFQVESRAQMSILPKIHPTTFYDIIVSIAIVRPGPIQGNIIHPYLRRRQGLEPVTYVHPSLEPILKRTLGVPLFQEQGMRLAVVAAGFNPSQADNLRRVMSHKRSQEKMDKLCEELGQGMKRNDFSEAAIKQIIHQLRAFANYGFPESHAASFSLLVYASAYLKRYFAPEFYCAMLNAQPMGFYSPATLIRDAQRHNVEVLPPDLTQSFWDCTLEDNSAYWRHEDLDVSKNDCYAWPASYPLRLRIGLRYVQGLGSRAKDALERAWSNGGRFTSVDDVLERSGLGDNELKLLARANAFQAFFGSRRQALWDTLSRLRKKVPTPLLDLLKHSDRENFQDLENVENLENLENLQNLENLENENLENVESLESLEKVKKVKIVKNLKSIEKSIPEMSPVEEITTDFRMMSLSTRDHLMTFYRDWATSHSIHSCQSLRTIEHGKKIRVAGGVITRQRPETAKGFVFITIEDETGMANIIVKPPKFEEYRNVLLGYSFLAFTGKLQKEQGVINLIMEHVEPLPALPGNPQMPARNFQ
jgi:error-prone DNA polymerase